MSAAVKVWLICCLLQGISCQDWAAFMPVTVRGLGGSCVMIPCRFTSPSLWDSHLDDSCKVIWKRGSWSRTTVFDSSLTGEDTKSNILQGNLTGNLREKDCTTIFYNLPSQHYNDYYLRLHCNNAHTRFNFRRSVIIAVEDSLPEPSLTPFSLKVEEGTPVRLICSAVAPCPILLPALTWTPSLGDTEEKVDATAVTSVLNFTASYRHHRQKISCAALYKRQAGNSDLSYESSLTIRVLYPPNNTSVSNPGPVQEGDWMSLTCSANANPAVYSYTWYKVDGDQATAVGWDKWLITRAAGEQNRFYCSVSNRFGTQNSPITQIDVRFAPKETSVSVDPAGVVLEGSSVTLTCSSRANPNVTNYAWYRDDEETAESGSTLVLTRADPSHTGGYKCEARNELGEEESPTVRLNVHYPPKNTSVLVDPSGPLLAGSSVTLTCRTAANPAAENFTWYRADGEKEEIVGFESDFTFNVTKLSEDKYRCEAANVHGGENSEPVSINVTFAPEVLPSSSCIRLSSEIRCTCDSHGNPTPSLEWELAGKLVDHAADLLTREEPLGSTGMRSIITLSQVDEDAPSIVCFSTNSLGSDSLTLNVSLSDTWTELHTTTILIGSAVGTLGVLLLLCVPLQIFIYRKRRCCHAPDKGLAASSDLLATDGPGSLEVDVIYANATILVEDTLHYADVDFAKLRAESESEPGGGEIRGLASRTAEYAEIRLHAKRASRGEETDEEEAAADTRDRR